MKMTDMSPAASCAPQPPTSVAMRSWYALVILTMIYSVHFLDRAMISIIVEPVRAEFGLNDRQIGLLTGLAYGASFALAGIPLGMLIDRVGRVKLLAALVAVWSGMTVLAGISQSYLQLLLARMGVGASEAGGSPASLSMISDMFPPKRRSTAIGIFYLSTGIGAILSVVVGGWVTAHYGWRNAMLIAGAPGLALAILLVLTVREPHRGALDAAGPANAPAPTLRAVLRNLRHNLALLHLMAGFAFTAGGVASIGSWLPAFLMRFHGFNVKEAGVSFAVAAGVFGAVGSFIGGLMSDKVAARHPRRRMDLAMLVCLCAAALGAAGTLVADGVTSVVLVAASTMLAFVAFPSAYATMLSIVAPNMRGTTTAATQIFSNLLGYGMGPFLVGVLSDAYGGTQPLRYAMLTVVAACFLGAASQFWLSARRIGQLPR